MSSLYRGSEPGESGNSSDLTFPDYSGDGFHRPGIEQTPFLDDSSSSKIDTMSPSYVNDERLLADVGRAENVHWSMAPARVVGLPVVPFVTKPTPSNETWKLAGLVVIFVIWVSTASTLLFLYMDRYLFG